MDWLTSLLQGQPGISGGLPGVPANTNSPFDPVPQQGQTQVQPAAGVQGVQGNTAGQGNPQQSRDNALITALRGVAAPPRPDVVKPTTPAAPHPLAIKAGALFDLLNQVSNPRAAMRPPTTLGGALGTGRY